MTGKERMMRAITFPMLTFMALALFPSVTGAEIGEVRVGVDGMTCVT